ncbi:MAG: hypothetical protein CL846_08320 [Crocinitomicaceae bacterium]|nr:hypothetical protein [Crocinitomicaceae bacterium]|tara:strand:- start:15871 stop:16839 length:969 start_codon:yes stop_codon:yes gene_type:complete
MENEEKKKINYSLYIILVLLAVLAYLAFSISKLDNNIHQQNEKINSLEIGNQEMNDMLINEGIISDDDDKSLKKNLNTLLNSYDSLEQTNTMAVDSINAQREKITSLMDDLQKEQAKSKKDKYKIYKLKKEAETLRTIMKGYIHTIDSLNTMNITLQNTLTEKNKTLNKVNSENEEFKKHNESLLEQVALGSVLQAGNITATALNIKSSGKQSETTRASRTNMIKGCCSLVGNKIAKAGNKDIYIRVLSKDGEFFPAPSPIIISDYDNNEIEMSAKRSVNYQNENTDLCIFYELQNPLQSGSYILEIYAEGFLIGSTSFALR